MSKIITNKIRCNYCGDIIESKSVHDYKSCRCGMVAVDGGHDYLRRTFHNDITDFEELSEYEEEKIVEENKE